MPRLCRMERSGPTIGGLTLDPYQDTSVKASTPTARLLNLHSIDCRVETMYTMLFYWRKQLMGTVATRYCGFRYAWKALVAWLLELFPQLSVQGRTKFCDLQGCPQDRQLLQHAFIWVIQSGGELVCRIVGLWVDVVRGLWYGKCRGLLVTEWGWCISSLSRDFGGL
jgi:hypothetical protein